MAPRSVIEHRFSVLTPTDRLKAAWLNSWRMANDEKAPASRNWGIEGFAT
jgi:hypothetical protein